MNLFTGFMMGHAYTGCQKGFIRSSSRDDLGGIHEEIYNLIFTVEETLLPSPCHLLNIHQLKHEWTATSPDGECNGSGFHLVVPMLESRVSKLLRPVVRRSLNSLHYLTGLKLLSLLYSSFS
ncbi:Uncharacterized protein HZ326_15996 [Fusarium oxysporum f. sp. albedinis]|nr:Uncharacterized protein HZ326_15996 [Fusarium oxysporum f. sp. albedinis]